MEVEQMNFVTLLIKFYSSILKTTDDQGNTLIFMKMNLTTIGAWLFSCTLFNEFQYNFSNRAVVYLL